MAANERHAGGDVERSFTVKLIPAEGDATELAHDLGDFFDAVDLAAEWVDREDPRREGRTGISIFEIREGRTRKVWDYPPAPSERQLTQIFGFDPVGWKSPVREYKGERHYPSPPQHRPAPVASALVLPPPQRPEPLRYDPPPQHAVVVTAPDPAPEREGVPVRSLPLRTLAEAAWKDRVSRAFLILALVGLWLAVTLTDPAPLVALPAAAVGLWWRRTARASVARRSDDDWE